VTFSQLALRVNGPESRVRLIGAGYLPGKIPLKAGGQRYPHGRERSGRPTVILRGDRVPGGLDMQRRCPLLSEAGRTTDRS
jgi:hypothetical protein